MGSLDSRGDYVALRILRYLEDREDLFIQTLAVDATSEHAMTHLIESLDVDVGGCFLMAAVLGDGMFQSHTEDSFERAFTPKVGAALALSKAVKIDTLEFLVCVTSVSGLFGNPGQTSYAAYVPYPSLPNYV